MIRQRLAQYLTSKGVSNYQFYKDTALSNGYLDKEGSIRSDILEKISYKYPEINLTWLITGQGDMIKEVDSVNETTKVYALRTDRFLEDQSIPLYDIEASAGLVELFRHNGDSTPVDTIRIPGLPKCDGSVYVTGDSMYPLLKSGDIVAYKEINDIQNNIYWGEMYLISIDFEGEEYISVKYVQKSEKGDTHIKLVSQNAHHQPKDVPLDKVRAIALIKATIRINSMG